MERRGNRHRVIWIALGIALFLMSAVAAGAAVAFLPDWTAFVVVIVSAYALWAIGDRARRS